jgi:tRNA-2-methylthio-N6-dimethylallyladenosine synthase
LDKTFTIVTFGCQMNVGDSDWLARALVSRGWRQVPEQDAWLFVVNTCSVRDKPEQKVYSELGRLALYRKGKPGLTAAVGGCVAQQIGRGFFERFPFVRLVFGSDGIAGAPDALDELAEDAAARIALLDFLSAYPEREDVLTLTTRASAPAFDADLGEPEAGPAQAFVNIMQGCDNFCAYCIVPYTRGRQKSRGPGAVLDECRTRVEQGAREITLLGQNVNSYGLDAGQRGVTGGVTGGIGFAGLLRQVAVIPGLLRLRFTTSHPKDIDPAVIRAFGELENLCPALHLPLQAGSDAVLRRMGRKYDRARYLAIVEALRQARPDIALTTDLIVGFPGETGEDFAQTLEMMELVRFESSFSFRYSDRPGVASLRLGPKVPDEVGQERLLRLQSLQNGITKETLKALEGCETDVLLEAPSRRQDEGGHFWRGRDAGGRVVNVRMSPDFAGQEHIGAALCGRMVRARILEAKNHSLLGEEVGPPW